MENNNIFFLVEEKNDINDNDTNDNNNQSIDQMMNSLLQDDKSFNIGESSLYTSQSQSQLAYYIERNAYSGEDELYYEQYTIKELMKICQYYGIAKDIKSAKCKKQDIVSTIAFFEGQQENVEIVRKRHDMWAYMTELAMDPKMKVYIFWN